MLIANRYRILDSSDRGGMGEVIFCEDLHLQRQIVLKYLQPGIEARRLLDEQKALSKVRSKHVVQLYDIVNIQGAVGKQSGIVLEYIDGETLQFGSFSVDMNFLNVIWQISCGLADIHLCGIIHRDIKPGNIKIDGEGVVKILDFGLSRNNEDAKTRCVIGTPIFMAPELWSSQTIAFDSSIDVYAFAVTCLTLITDSIPRSLFNRPPSQPNIAEFSAPFSGFPSEITNTLYQCLAAERRNRPSMQTIKKVLEKYLLKDRHRATVVLNGVVNTLDCKNRRISLNANVGNLTIEYDGLTFKVTQVTGAVYINNTSVSVGTEVPGCCVLTFGIGSGRQFVTFDVSNPEVMP